MSERLHYHLVRYSFLLWSSLWLLGAGCTQHNVSSTTQVSFYHWKTSMAVDTLAQSFLDTLQVRRIYVKYFDLDWDDARQEVVPLANVQFAHLPAGDIELVPTIFITNRSMAQLPADQVSMLAQKLVGKIRTLHPAQARPVTEIQLDCDWTASTRERYFDLLRAIKKEVRSQTRLSATIRLHQISGFRQTGVPPVAAGSLMLYNVGQVSNWDETNSILNTAAVRPYLTDAIDRYPLPLRLALPLYSWGGVFRESELLYLINGLRTADLTDTLRFKSIGSQRYEVQKSTYLNSYYLYRGDRIRLETIYPDSLHHVAQELIGWLPPGCEEITFYHLDSDILRHWTYDDLEELLRILP